MNRESIEQVAAALESVGLTFRATQLRAAKRGAVAKELQTCVTSITDVIECQGSMMPVERFRAFQAARQACLQLLTGREMHCRECGTVGCALCKGAA